jgi:hypothetical protein
MNDPNPPSTPSTGAAAGEPASVAEAIALALEFLEIFERGDADRLIYLPSFRKSLIGVRKALREARIVHSGGAKRIAEARLVGVREGFDWTLSWLARWAHRCEQQSRKEYAACKAAPLGAALPARPGSPSQEADALRTIVGALAIGAAHPDCPLWHTEQRLAQILPDPMRYPESEDRP